MKKLKFSALMMGISATSLAAVAAGVAVGVSQSTSHTSEVAGPVNPVTAPEKPAPLTAGRYVTVTFTATPGDTGVTIIGNPRSKILSNTPFGTALAPKVTKEGYHFVAWTKTVGEGPDAHEEVVPSTELVTADLEVHAKLAKDLSALKIEGREKQFWDLNYNAGTDGTHVTDGTGVLDYHVFDLDGNEITEADNVVWEVFYNGREGELEETTDVTITPTTTAGETWATFNSLGSMENEHMLVKSDYTLRATVTIDGTEVVAEKVVSVDVPSNIDYDSAGAVEIALPEELTNPMTEGGSENQLIWFPNVDVETPAWYGWVALDMNSVYDEPEDGAEVAEDIKAWSWMDGTGAASPITITRAEFNPWCLFFGKTFGTTERGQTAEIGDYFFRNCSSFDPCGGPLEDEAFAANYAPITAIGQSAFEGCASMSEFGDFFNNTAGGISHLTSIGDNFLADCVGFDDTHFFVDEESSPAVGEIGDFFMMNCTAYTSGTTSDVMNLENVNKIDPYFMYNTGVMHVAVGEKTGFVGNHFLENCADLATLDFSCSPTAFEFSDFLESGTLTMYSESVRTTPVAISSDYSELTDTPVDDFLRQFPSFRSGTEGTILSRQLSHETAQTYAITVLEGGETSTITTDPAQFTEGTTTRLAMSVPSCTVSSIVVNGKTLKKGVDWEFDSVNFCIEIYNLSAFCGPITINVVTL